MLSDWTPRGEPQGNTDYWSAQEKHYGKDIYYFVFICNGQKYVLIKFYDLKRKYELNIFYELIETHNSLSVVSTISFQRVEWILDSSSSHKSLNSLRQCFLIFVVVVF